MSGENATLNAGGSSTPGQDATIGSAWANMIQGDDAGSLPDSNGAEAILGGSQNDQQTTNDGSANDGLPNFDDIDFDHLFDDEDPDAGTGNSGAPADATGTNTATSDDRGPVPYDRFREVNERAKLAQQYQAQLDAWGPVIDRFKGEGFDSAQAVMAALEAQRAQAEEASVTAKYQQQVDNDDMDPELATARRDAELLQMRWERQLREMETYRVQRESDTAWVNAKLPDAVKPLFDNMVSQGYPPATAVSVLADTFKGIRRTVAQETVQRLGKGRAVPTPTTPAQTGRAAPPAGHNPNNPFQARTLSDMFGIPRG